MHRTAFAALALALIAPPLSAQVAPSPDSTTGDKSAMPAPSTVAPQDGKVPKMPAPGLPLDMQTSSPPAASGDAAPVGTATKDRAKPSTTTSKIPR